MIGRCFRQRDLSVTAHRLAIRLPEGNVKDTIREIQSLSRYDETPKCLAIDRTQEGYVPLGSSAAVATQQGKTATQRYMHWSPAAADASIQLLDNRAMRTAAEPGFGDMLETAEGGSRTCAPRGARTWVPQRERQ